MAIYHLKQELGYHDDFHLLPQLDLNNCFGDTDRIYRFLLPQWLDYLQHLRQDNPYLIHCKYVLIRLKLIEPSSSIKDRDTYVTLSQQKGSYV